MKIKALITILIFISLSWCAYASYIGMLRDMDVNLLCIVSFTTMPVVAILLVLGGYLLVSGTSPGRRTAGKGLIKNAIIGMILVVILIGLSISIGGMEDKYWSICWGIQKP